MTEVDKMITACPGGPKPNLGIRVKSDFVILRPAYLGLGLNLVPNQIINSIHIVWRVYKPKTRSPNQTEPPKPNRSGKNLRMAVWTYAQSERPQIEIYLITKHFEGPFFSDFQYGAYSVRNEFSKFEVVA